MKHSGGLFRPHVNRPLTVRVGDSDVTFLLTGGGHNAGIVSEPGHPGRRYRVAFKGASANYADPDVWLAQNEPRAGSWWPEWAAWLDAQSGASVAPPKIGLRAIIACDTQFFAAILPRIDVDQGALCPPAYTETVACGDLDVW